MLTTFVAALFVARAQSPQVEYIAIVDNRALTADEAGWAKVYDPDKLQGLVEKAKGTIEIKDTIALVTGPGLANLDVRQHVLAVYTELATTLKSGPGIYKFAELGPEAQGAMQTVVAPLGSDAHHTLSFGGDSNVAIEPVQRFTLTVNGKSVSVMTHPAHSQAMGNDGMKRLNLNGPSQTNGTRPNLDAGSLWPNTPTDVTKTFALVTRRDGSPFDGTQFHVDSTMRASLLKLFWEQFTKFENDWTSKTKAARNVVIQSMMANVKYGSDWTGPFDNQDFSNLPDSVKSQLRESLLSNPQAYGFSSTSEASQFLTSARVSDFRPSMQMYFGHPSAGIVGFPLP